MMQVGAGGSNDVPRRQKASVPQSQTATQFIRCPRVTRNYIPYISTPGLNTAHANQNAI